jgi:hypothetical protein
MGSNIHFFQGPISIQLGGLGALGPKRKTDSNVV